MVVQNKNVRTGECDPKLIAPESRNNHNPASLKQTESSRKSQPKEQEPDRSRVPPPSRQAAQRDRLISIITLIIEVLPFFPPPPGARTPEPNRRGEITRRGGPSGAPPGRLAVGSVAGGPCEEVHAAVNVFRQPMSVFVRL